MDSTTEANAGILDVISDAIWTRSLRKVEVVPLYVAVNEWQTVSVALPELSTVPAKMRFVELSTKIVGVVESLPMSCRLLPAADVFLATAKICTG